jgi:hypothetical protein
MRRLLLPTLVAIALAAVAAVAMAAGSSSTSSTLKWGTAGDANAASADATPKGMHRLVVYTTLVRDTFIDVGEAGESAGDMDIFEDRVWNRSRTRVIGRGSAECTLRITTVSCNGSIWLRGRGSLQVNGVLFDGRGFPVTGGTGRFAGAGGQMMPVPVGDGTTRLVFLLTNDDD